MTFRFSPVAPLFVLALSTATLVSSAHAQSRPTALFRSFGLLGPNASLSKVTVGKPQVGQNRTASGNLTKASQPLTGPLKFSFSGFSRAQQNVLQNFVNANYNRMVSVYGAPAPEQAGKTVRVVFESRASSYEPPAATNTTGGTIYFGYEGEPKSGDDLLRAKNTYNFTRLALIAFQGPRVPAFDFSEGSYVEPWLYGMADAGALQVAYLAGGSKADFNPSSISNYALSLYDYLNRPELGNAFVYSRTEREDELAISFFRAAMAQAAFLKLMVENPNFLAQFNARLYGRGAARTSISPSELKSLAAGVTSTVEGRSFSDWVREQYALDATVTTGQKLYMVVYPLTTAASPTGAPNASVFTQAFSTNGDGSESASTGYGSLRAFDQSGRDISAQSSNLSANNVLSFNDSTRPGEAEAVVGFSGFNDSNRALVTLKANFAQAEATNYVPYGAAGTSTSNSSFFGGTLGGQNGTLQIGGSATQNVSVTNGTWAATAPYPSGPRVQTTFTFGGATLRRNSAWFTAGDQLRSAPFLLQVPSSLQTLNFSAPAGQSQIRMVSLPGFPIKTDEAAALNIAPDALDLARYRPNLSPATTNAAGALVFGIGGSNYELYPNISAPLAPGRGYWLGVGQNGYSTPVQASPPPADKDYEVPLLGGWNQIGVPFNRALAPASIQVRNGGFAPVALGVAQSRGWVAPGIWRWRPEGGYVRADVGNGQLAPFEGYFIFAAPQRGVSLVFSPNASANARTSAVSKASGWSLALRAVGENTDDIAGRFGVSDAPNIAKPPAGARVVSLRFEGADANGASSAGSGLAESYVAQLGAGAQWSAIVDGTAKGENVSLKWDKFDGAMRGVRLSLLDSVTGATTTMKSGGEYPFVSDGTPRRFAIAALAGGSDGKLAPTLTPDSARTADILTVNPNASGFAPNANLVLSYAWRNGRRVLENNGATLDLSEPGNGERGDTITVEVSARDEAGNVATGTASTVIGNSAPFVGDGSLRVQSGQSASVELFASDADGDELRLSRSNSPKLGVADVRKDGGVWKLFYTGFKGASGDDEVEVIAFDGFGGRSQTAKIKVSLASSAPVNRAPVAMNGSVESARGEIAVKTLMASDADGDALSFRLVRGPKFGTGEIVLDPADGKWKLRARNLQVSSDGTDSAQFVAVDAQGRESNVATITIYLRNRAPIVSDVSANVVSGAEIAIPIAGSDGDGDALTFKRVGGPRNGSGELRRDSDGAWKMFYRSRAGWTGVENVSYVAVDAQGRPSAPATIAITVTSSGASALSTPSASAGRS